MVPEKLEGKARRLEPAEPSRKDHCGLQPPVGSINEPQSPFSVAVCGGGVGVGVAPKRASQSASIKSAVQVIFLISSLLQIAPLGAMAVARNIPHTALMVPVHAFSKKRTWKWCKPATTLSAPGFARDGGERSLQRLQQLVEGRHDCRGERGARSSPATSGFPASSPLFHGSAIVCHRPRDRT
jgi:hypothetical protein